MIHFSQKSNWSTNSRGESNSPLLITYTPTNTRATWPCFFLIFSLQTLLNCFLFNRGNSCTHSFQPPSCDLSTLFATVSMHHHRSACAKRSCDPLFSCRVCCKQSPVVEEWQIGLGLVDEEDDTEDGTVVWDKY